MTGFPQAIARVNHVEPVPRRIRAFHGAETIADTISARYVWEWPHYPQFYIPRRDVREDLLVSDGRTEDGPLGTVRLYAFGDQEPAASPVGRLVIETPRAELADTFRFDWDPFDAWFEEDEEVFVHPRNPYTRVDALRSTRSVRIELKGVTLAESASPIMVFETGLPTRYYLNRTEVRFDHLEWSPTVTRCPYKGTTSSYWSAVVGGRTHPDLAWAYDFPSHQVLSIAGLVAFYNERVDLFLDGQRQERPVTHFSKS